MCLKKKKGKIQKFRVPDECFIKFLILNEGREDANVVGETDNSGNSEIFVLRIFEPCLYF